MNSTKRFPVDALPLLGVEHDRTIAREFRVGVLRVRIEREARGIAPARRRKRCVIPLALLGTVPDTVLADRYGVHPTTVWHHRRVLGIPAAPRQRERDLSDDLVDWMREHDTTHTMREIMDALGLTWSATQARLARAVKRGQVERIEGRPVLWVIS